MAGTNWFFPLALSLTMATACQDTGGADEKPAVNQAPVVSDVVITPNPAVNDQTLTCGASVTDPDGDEVTIEMFQEGKSVFGQIAQTVIPYQKTTREYQNVTHVA